MLMTVVQFQGQTDKGKKTNPRGSLAKIDTALAQYHLHWPNAATPKDQIDALWLVFAAAITWLQKKQGRSEMKTHRFGWKTNYIDTNFLSRRIVVRDLGQ